MNVLLFGATGMVGGGVLHVCLADRRVTSVLAVVRSSLGMVHPKLRELPRADFFNYGDLAPVLAEVDACFFCAGVSAVGMSEADYHRLTFDLTLAAGTALASVRPDSTFCYVSGQGTDSSEQSATMWARVKGKTENALAALPFNAYMFRPGFIQTRRGAKSKTRLYRIFYTVLGPLYPVLKLVAPRYVTTSENIGRAMIEVATIGYPKRVIETRDINALAEAG